MGDPYIWTEVSGGRRRRHVLSIDEHRVKVRAGVADVQRLLSVLRGPEFEGIITTNYDMLFEYALTTKGFHYGGIGERLAGRGPYPVSQWRNPVRLSGKTPLAKLHGSISWPVDGRYTDGRGALNGRSLVVAPVPEKVAPPALEDTWRLAGRLLSNTAELIVFGFAFNPYDEAVLTLLRTNAMHVQRVMLVDPYPNLEEARRLWPEAQIDSSDLDAQALREWLGRDGH